MYELQNFKRWLVKNRKKKNLKLFFDIETYQYNELKGKEKPSSYKNNIFALGVGYFDEEELNFLLLPNFKILFDTILDTLKYWKVKPSFELISHNGNKYDNHFLRRELIYFFNMKVYNIYLRNAIDNNNTVKIKDLTPKEKQEGVILEKRVKSKNNLELIFYLDNVKFHTTDNYIKTNSSIKVLGEKLERLGFISHEMLKGDFDYKKYNLNEDLSDVQAFEYSFKIFKGLTLEEKNYIRNDIIILANSVKYYPVLFKGFDYEKITFTSNILEYYNNNDLTSYQLLRKVGQKNKKLHIKYTDFTFNNENFYDYLKKFYSGGLNIYNTKYLGKEISNLFSIDINSSYPYVMHRFKVPTFYHSSQVFKNGKKIELELYDENYFILYEISREMFDFEIIEKIPSRVLKQIFVKYYGKNQNIYINSNTIKIIEDICKIELKSLTVLSWVKFECFEFGSKKEIDKAYFIKTQGSKNQKIIYNSPYDIKETNEKNKNKFTSEEVENSKIVLNGLYGIPALRPYFNLFRLGNDGDYFNLENGFKNNERNIVFSTFVTSVALYNLLYPLKFLSHEEIDENLVYMDTDSLYFFKKIKSKLPDSLFDENHLGKWSFDYENIEKMYILNHKKYCLYVNNQIKVKCGGVRLDSFDLDVKFEDFIKYQFKDGVKLKTLRSILNNQGTISLYPSTINLEIGKGYPVYADDESVLEQKEKIFKKAKKIINKNVNDVMYIESNIGSFSLQELTPKKNSSKKLPLSYLKMHENIIKKRLKIEK